MSYNQVSSNTQRYYVNKSLREKMATVHNSMKESMPYYAASDIKKWIVTEEFRVLFARSINESVLNELTIFTNEDPLAHRKFEKIHSHAGLGDNSQRGVVPSSVNFTKEQIEMVYETFSKQGQYYHEDLQNQEGRDQWQYILSTVVRAISNNFEDMIFKKYANFDMRRRMIKEFTINDEIDYEQLIDNEKKVYDILSKKMGLDDLDNIVNNSIDPLNNEKFIALVPSKIRAKLIKLNSKTLRRELNSVDQHVAVFKRGYDLKTDVMERDLTSVNFVNNLKFSTRHDEKYNPMVSLGSIGEYFSAHNRLKDNPKKYTSDEISTSLYNHKTKQWDRITPQKMIKMSPLWGNNGELQSIKDIDNFGMVDSKGHEKDFFSKSSKGDIKPKALVGELLNDVDVTDLKSIADNIAYKLNMTDKVKRSINYLVDKINILRTNEVYKKAELGSPLDFDLTGIDLKSPNDTVSYGFGSLWGLRYLNKNKKTINGSKVNAGKSLKPLVNRLNIQGNELDDHYEIFRKFVLKYKELTPDSELWNIPKNLKENGMSGMTDEDVFFATFVWNTSHFLFINKDEFKITTKVNPHNVDDSDDEDDDNDEQVEDDDNNNLFSDRESKDGKKIESMVKENYDEYDNKDNKKMGKWMMSALVMSESLRKSIQGVATPIPIALAPLATDNTWDTKTVNVPPKYGSTTLDKITIPEYGEPFKNKRLNMYPRDVAGTESTKPVNNFEDLFSGTSPGVNSNIIGSNKRTYFTRENLDDINDLVKKFAEDYSGMDQIAFKMYALLELNQKTMLSLVKHDIFLPFDLYLCRNNIRVESSAVTYTIPKSSITHIKSSNVDQGSDPVKSQDTYIIRYKAGIGIKDYERIYAAPNAHVTRLEKTTNKFFDPKKQLNEGQKYYSIKNKVYGTGKESLMVVLCKFGSGGKDLGNKNMTGAYTSYGDTIKNRWKDVNFFRTSVMFGLKQEYEIQNSRRTIDVWNSSKVNYLMALGRYARHNPNTEQMSMLIKGDAFLKEDYEPQNF